MKRIVLDYQATERRLALFEGERIQEIHIERASQSSIVGFIYLGIVREVLPAMNAAFVDIGLEKSAYLSYKDTPQYQLGKNEASLKQGEKILVQILRDPVAEKGAKISALIELATESLIYIKGEHFCRTPKKTVKKFADKWKSLADLHLLEDEAIIVRSLFLHATEEHFIEALNDVREQYNCLLQRAKKMKAPACIYQENTFVKRIGLWTKEGTGEIVLNDAVVLNELKALELPPSWTMIRESKQSDYIHTWLNRGLQEATKKKVELLNGGNLVFEKTEAMHVVDVNTGAFMGKQNQERTFLETNLLAAREIGRQIILRNLTGMIMIDFINMKNQLNQDRVTVELKRSLNKDGSRSTIVGFTELGIMQLTRKKEGPELSEWVLEACSTCRGTGWVSSREAGWQDLERLLEYQQDILDEALWIDASPEFFSYLNEERKKELHDLAERRSSYFYIRESHLNAATLFNIRASGKSNELEERIVRADQVEHGGTLMRIQGKQD